MSDYSSFLCTGPTSGYYSPDQVKENSGLIPKNGVWNRLII